MSKKQQSSPEDTASGKESPPACSCVSDPFASLPSELRPKTHSKEGGLRQVICPGCGRDYWTNRKTDICIKCGSSGGKG